MITLLGVGHVFGMGGRIRAEIAGRRPDLVCLELDEARLQALEAPGGGRPSGLYGTLAAFQQRVAAQYGSAVGEEMLAAREAAQDLGIPVALIDRDARETWRRFRSALGPLELVRIVVSVLLSVFVGRDRVERELDRYREDSLGFLETLGEDYPALKVVLLDERNDHMAAALRRLQDEHGRIVAVVGDGHVEGLRVRLQDLDVEVLRLWELREGEPPEA